MLRSLLPFAILNLISVSCKPAPTAQVYFYPSLPEQSQHSPPTLNEFDANSLISHHLGFDMYQSAGDREDSESWWNEMGSALLRGGNGVGEGMQDAVLIVIQSDHPEDFVPESMQPTFIIQNPPPASMFTDLIHAYVERAHQIGDSVFSSLIDTAKEVAGPTYKALLDAFDVASASARAFVKELEVLVGFVDKESDEDTTKGVKQTFSAFEVKGLAEVQVEKGRESDQYLTAAKSVQAVLSNPVLQSRRVALIVVPPESSTTSTSRHSKRQSQQKPLLASSVPGPVFAVSTCFTSNDTCSDATNACSGHGSCVSTTRAGKTCYTCACSVTKNDQGRRQWWGGAACQKLDLSTSFTMLAGTVIFLIVLTVFSLGLLYSIGAETLPNTLTAGAVPHTKRE